MPPAPADRRTLLVVWGAMIMGCLSFFGVAAYVRSLGGMSGDGVPPVLAWITLGLAVLLVAASWSVSGLVRPAGAPEAVARARFIIGWALREGAAMFGMVVWLIGGDAKALAAFAIGVAALAATGPTEGRWRAAVEAAGGRPDGARPMVR